MEETEKKKSAAFKKLKRWGTVALLILSIVAVLSLTVSAWLVIRKSLAAYAPVSTNESLYIGAGHAEADNFESIQYLYFDGINADGANTYSDYVFCVFGQFVSGFRIQLAYTTNNQFVYEIYNATESTEYSAGAVAHTTHNPPVTTYYYTATGNAIVGTYLNTTTRQNGDVTETIAGGLKHAATYGTYSSSNVNPYAEPIYWQTYDLIDGYSLGNFTRYFILRVYTNGKTSNDRETDVLCIAAKSFTQ